MNYTLAKDISSFTEAKDFCVFSLTEHIKKPTLKWVFIIELFLQFVLVVLLVDQYHLK